mgnify:CR=1 FL=1
MAHSPAIAARMSDWVKASVATHPVMSMTRGKPYPSVIDAMGPLAPVLTYTMSPTATWSLGDIRASTDICLRSDVAQVVAAWQEAQAEYLLIMTVRCEPFTAFTMPRL